MSVTEMKQNLFRNFALEHRNSVFAEMKIDQNRFRIELNNAYFTYFYDFN